MKMMMSGLFFSSLVFTSSTQARSGVVTPPTPTTPTKAEVAAAASSTKEAEKKALLAAQNAVKPETIKQIAEKSEKKNGMGIIAGAAAAVFCGYKASVTCGTPGGQAACYFYIAGAGVAAAITLNMLTAQRQSNATAQAVTVGEGMGKPNTAATDSTETIAKDPTVVQALALGTKLKKEGWKFDTVKKTATAPDGKLIAVTPHSSAAEIQASNLSSSAKKDLLQGQAGMNAAATHAAQKGVQATHATDGESMDVGGASGAGGGAKVASNFTMPGAETAGQKVGLARDPADVSGMQKDFRGEPIGVSGDSLFQMIDRRYQLHESKGSFLAPSK